MLVRYFELAALLRGIALYELVTGLLPCDSGNGLLTQALLDHPSVDRVIAVEHVPVYTAEIEVNFCSVEQSQRVQTNETTLKETCRSQSWKVGSRCSGSLLVGHLRSYERKGSIRTSK